MHAMLQNQCAFNTPTNKSPGKLHLSWWLKLNLAQSDLTGQPPFQQGLEMSSDTLLRSKTRTWVELTNGELTLDVGSMALPLVWSPWVPSKHSMVTKSVTPLKLKFTLKTLQEMVLKRSWTTISLWTQLQVVWTPPQSWTLKVVPWSSTGDPSQLITPFLINFSGIRETLYFNSRSSFLFPLKDKLPHSLLITKPRKPVLSNHQLSDSSCRPPTLVVLEPTHPFFPCTVPENPVWWLSRSLKMVVRSSSLGKLPQTTEVLLLPTTSSQFNATTFWILNSQTWAPPWDATISATECNLMLMHSTDSPVKSLWQTFWKTTTWLLEISSSLKSLLSIKLALVTPRQFKATSLSFLDPHKFSNLKFWISRATRLRSDGTLSSLVQITTFWAPTHSNMQWDTTPPMESLKTGFKPMPCPSTLRTSSKLLLQMATSPTNSKLWQATNVEMVYGLIP